MTLFKQIALMLSLFLLAILTTVLLLNFQSANEAVQEQLYEDAKNTATSLSLTLGNALGNESMMSTMINANFDSGHYERISLMSMDKRLIFQRVNETTELDVPLWFSNLVPIEAPVALAQVSSGWSPIALLEVQSDSTHAYIQLYGILQDLLISFAIIAFIALIILHTLLHVILKPLKKVQNQAEAIINNQFIIQAEIPYTTEFKDVVHGMNAMVKKVQGIFQKGNAVMQQNHELLYTDPITKLYNRRYFLIKFPEQLRIDARFEEGTLIIAALQGALEANQIIGRVKVDAMFQAIAENFKLHAESFDTHVVARMNGTEFAILLPNCVGESSVQIIHDLWQSSEAIMKTYLSDAQEFSNDTYGVTMGAYNYSHTQNIGDILSQADYALSQANLEKTQRTCLLKHDTNTFALGKEAWREMIEQALLKGKFALETWNVFNTKAKEVHHHVFTISMHEANKTRIAYGEFIAPAIALGLTPSIYHHVLDMILKHPIPTIKGKVYALRLPSEYLLASTTLDEITQLLQTHNKTLPFQLVVEFPDHVVHTNQSLVLTYATLFRRFYINIGIYQFTGESNNFNYLKELHPLYIKADTKFLLDQSTQSMAALQIITDTAGIDLVATGVRTQKELHTLENLKVSIVQGRVTEEFA